jgi:hypothetical protein
MKSKIKKVIDYLEEKSYFLAVPLFLWTVLATALGKHKLDWIDASFLIGYTFLARSKR